MKRRAFFLHDTYIFIPVLAIVCGLIFPDVFIPFSKWSAVLIAAIFFIAALDIDIKSTLREFRDIRLLFLETLLMLVTFPIAVYLVASIAISELALPLMLLAAMPAAMSAPLLADLIGGRKSLAVVLTLLTSFLAPFTIPLVIKILVGDQISMDYISMFSSLAMIIVIPSLIAQGIHVALPQLATKTYSLRRPVSVVLLSLIIGGAVADQSTAINDSFVTGRAWVILLVTSICFVVFLLVGYFLPRWRSHGDRLASAVCLAYMNFSLSIYVAETYFPHEKVLVPLALSVIPWTMTYVILSFIEHRNHSQSSRR